MKMVKHCFFHVISVVVVSWFLFGDRWGGTSMNGFGRSGSKLMGVRGGGGQLQKPS